MITQFLTVNLQWYYSLLIRGFSICVLINLTRLLLVILPKKRVLKLVELFSGHCRAIKS